MLRKILITEARSEVELKLVRKPGEACIRGSVRGKVALEPWPRMLLFAGYPAWYGESAHLLTLVTSALPGELFPGVL